MFDDMAEVWKHPVVVRSDVGRFSGGLLHPRTMANLDSLGLGPRGMFYLARKVAYPTNELVDWMKEKYRQENFNPTHSEQNEPRPGFMQAG